MNRDIQIIMHTHWDREWYFTKDETKVLLRNHMENVFDFLENNPDAIYILDGQCVMIDDYLELEPMGEDKIKHYVKNQQLRVGPWYTQTDLLLVHGESIIRNLYYGIKLAQVYGNPMLVGYAPDTFGHASQMPQIYKQFGIDSTIFWRGFSEMKAIKSDFIWEGIDKTQIIGVNLATGYQGAKYLECEPEALRSRMQKIMSVLDRYSATDARLIMNGHDQMPVQENISEIIQNIRLFYPEDKVKISDFENYVNHLREYDLEVVSGELTHCKHSRIHRTIGSTRMDIKLLNSEIEHKIYDVLEPLAVIGQQAGIEYPHKVIEKVLKILFGVHAHDSIGGCNSDDVNQDIKQRLINAKELVDTQIELTLRLLTLSNKDDQKTIVVLNLLPESREDEWVEIELQTRMPKFRLLDENFKEFPFMLIEQRIEDAGRIDRQVAARLLDIKVYISKVLVKIDSIDGLSVKVLSCEELELVDTLELKSSSAFAIENKWYKISLVENNFKLTNKLTGEVIEEIISIENGGDAGDSYDYSPPHEDRLFTSIKNGRIRGSVNIGQFMQELKFNLDMDVPANLEDRKLGISSQTIQYHGFIRLYENDDRVYCELKTENQCIDTRHRIVFKTNRRNDKVLVDGYLSSQFKPIYLKEELDVWEQEKWAEKPISVETMQNFVAIGDNHGDAVIYTKGLKEYEVIDDRIYITLYRSFSHLGKRNLVNRPGRPSGIEIETPSNQLLGQHFKFEFAFSFNQKPINYSKVAKAIVSPLLSYQRKEFNRFNLNTPTKVKKPVVGLSLDLKDTVVSAVKRTEVGNHLLIRVFNPKFEEVTIELPEGTFKASALEEPIIRLESVAIKPQEFVQFIVKNF